MALLLQNMVQITTNKITYITVFYIDLIIKYSIKKPTVNVYCSCVYFSIWKATRVSGVKHSS